MDWAEFAKRRQKAPATARVPLCADGDAVRQLEEAQHSGDAEAVKKLRDKVTKATWWVTCTALGAEDYMALKDTHRPSDPEKIKRGHEWDEATFGPALIAASTPLTEEEAADLWATVTAAERAQLFLACRDLNETVPDLGFTEPATAVTRGTGRPSTTASRKASR